MKKTTKRANKVQPVVLPTPKPQIPQALASIRREVAKYQTLTELLETGLRDVLRPGEVRTDGAKNLMSSAAPIAETLSEAAGQLSALNARVKDLLSRLEI